MSDETRSIDMAESDEGTHADTAPGTSPDAASQMTTNDSDVTVAQAGAEPAGAGGAAAAGAAGAAGAAEGGKRRWRGRSNASKRTKADPAPVVADEAARDDSADSAEEQPVEQKTVKQKTQKKTKEKPVAEKSETKETKERKPFFGDQVSVNQVRSFVGRAVWLVCVVFALSLALTALFVALSANTQNEAVVRIYEFANGVDFGVFDLSNPIKDFDSSQGPSQDVRTALFNYGIAAIVWLLIGRVADRIIQP